MRRSAAPLLLVLLNVLAIAAVTIENFTEWRVQAKASPIVKLGNLSLHPVVTSRWRTLEGLNVTTYGLCFVPGWEENYTVGRLDTRVSGLSTHLCRVEQPEAASYWISLGGVLQVSQAQSCGAPVQLPAALSWRSIAVNEYWVLTTARFTVGGAEVWQFINFSAKPMSLLINASYGCTRYTRSDDFSGACVLVRYTFDASIPNNRTYTRWGYVSLSRDFGNPPPSLKMATLPGGYASFFIDYSREPFSAAANFSFQYYLWASMQDRDYIQVHFFIDLDVDGSPDLELIFYGSEKGTDPLEMAYPIYRRELPSISQPMPGFSSEHKRWWNITLGQIYPTGYVVGLALTAYSPRGTIDVYWDNINFSRCAFPSYLGAYTRGSGHTLVYVDATRSPSTPPSVATEVDAHGATGDPAVDYGIAAAIYDVRRWGSVAAGGFSFTVRGLYARDAADVRNNLAYVSVGVDSDGDGSADREFIFYRHDVAAGYLGVIVSVHVNRGAVVCAVASDGSCTPSNPAYAVHNLGSMVSGQVHLWSGSLPPGQEGLVLWVAFAAVDASGNAPCTSNDFWVWWDDFAIAYYACTPLPPDWSISGDTVYRGLVPGAVAYAARFDGDGGFYVYDAGLNPLFGVRKVDYAHYVRCGPAEIPLDSYPAAYWVDLRLLSGVWEAMLRSFDGSILARYACAPAGAPSYVGFTGVEYFEFTAWGCNG